ncbi:MAG: MotA/TolQ/ExbB proton channel family protein [Desulfovibrionaceae bacterium]
MRLLLSLAVLLALSSPALANTWPEAAEALEGRAAQAERSAEETRDIVRQGRAALEEELAPLRGSVAEKRRAFAGLREQYEALLERERALAAELDDQAHEIKTMDGAIRTSAKQARDAFHESLTGAEHPEREAVLDEILQPGRFPGLSGIQALLGLYLEEMDASGRVVLRRGAYTAPDGSLAEGEIVRVGAFTAAWRGEGGVGFLRPEGEASLLAVDGDPGWGRSGLMNDFFDAQSGPEGGFGVFPVDISGGGALARLQQQQRSLGEWLDSGGVLVWPILLVGLAALGIVGERFWTLGRIRANSDRHMGRVLELLAARRWRECAEYCAAQARFPTCRIIGHTLSQTSGQMPGHLPGETSVQGAMDKEGVENAFQEGLLKEMPLLERFLPTLAVLAAVAPLLGLLGTVTGMINTFQVITVYGTGDPRMMSGGISEALVTTQLGLAVAVPIMILHHVLDRRVDRIVGDMEEKGASFAVALLGHGKEADHAVR